MKQYVILFLAITLLPFSTLAQQVEKPDINETETEKLLQDAFQSTALIDNQTSIINSKNTFEFNIQHRFGTVTGGNRDLLGLWGPSNIRLGLTYSILDRVSVGFGTTKNNRLQDFNLKVGLVRQSRAGNAPVNITYYGDMAISTRDKANFPSSVDRFSYFNQLIISRKFSNAFSFQIAPSVSHYNLISPSLSNSQFGVALGGRLKISEKSAGHLAITSIVADYSQPIGQNSNNPGLSVGLETRTELHIFQVFLGNYNGIVPQQTYMLNENKLSDGDILMGFNIIRLFNFSKAKK